MRYEKSFLTSYFMFKPDFNGETVELLSPRVTFLKSVIPIKNTYLFPVCSVSIETWQLEMSWWPKADSSKSVTSDWPGISTTTPITLWGGMYVTRHFIIASFLSCQVVDIFFQNLPHVCNGCPSGAFASEVDGTREHLSRDIHHEEWRLGLWNPPLGDLLTW